MGASGPDRAFISPLLLSKKSVEIVLPLIGYPASSRDGYPSPQRIGVSDGVSSEGTLAGWRIVFFPGEIFHLLASSALKPHFRFSSFYESKLWSFVLSKCHSPHIMGRQMR